VTASASREYAAERPEPTGAALDRRGLHGDAAPTAHTTEQILRAAAAWAWFPRDSEQEKTHLQLVRYPARFGGGVRGSQVDSRADSSTVIDHALERTQAWGETVFTFWTNESDSPDLEDELRRRGADHIDTVAVFARAIDRPAIDVPPGITAEIVRTLEQVRDVDSVNVPVWEQAALDDEGLRTELAEVSAALDAGEGLRVLARLDGIPVSTGGCTIVDAEAYYYSFVEYDPARIAGAYRAVLAVDPDNLPALNNLSNQLRGRVSTSAPILRRAGFVHYGDEQAYRLAV